MKTIDLITILGLLLATLGLWVNWLQLRRKALTDRAQLLVTIYDQYMNNVDTLRILYDIAYDRFTYSADFHESATEKALDRLLFYFDKIAILQHLGAITLTDIGIVADDMREVYMNREVQSYFEFLDRLRVRGDYAGKSFDNFRQLAERLAGTPSPEVDITVYRKELSEFFANRDS